MPASVQQLNQDLADRINAEACRDPQSPYAGKFVGIANGRVAVIADNMDDLAEQLRRCVPNPENMLCIEAGLDYQAVREIWMSC